MTWDNSILFFSKICVNAKYPEFFNDTRINKLIRLIVFNFEILFIKKWSNYFFQSMYNIYILLWEKEET